MRLGAALLAVVLVGCVTPAPEERAHLTSTEKDPPVAPGRADSALRAQVVKFLDATKARDFDTAWRLLAEPLRDRYTPKRLAADFDAEPLVGERLARIRRALDLPFRVEGRRAYLDLSDSRVLELVEEPTGWHIAALE